MAEVSAAPVAGVLMSEGAGLIRRTSERQLNFVTHEKIDPACRNPRGIAPCRGNGIKYIDSYEN